MCPSTLIIKDHLIEFSLHSSVGLGSPAFSQAAESSMIIVHLLWSQHGLKIEYLMMAELQQFQKFLSCATSNGLSFFLPEYLNSPSHWARKNTLHIGKRKKKRGERKLKWNLKPLLLQEMNCVWIVKQTLQTVWNSFVKDRVSKSIASYMLRRSSSCCIAVIWSCSLMSGPLQLTGTPLERWDHIYSEMCRLQMQQEIVHSFIFFYYLV